MKNDIASYEIVTTWRGGMASASICRDNTVEGHSSSMTKHVVTADEPAALGGKDSAPSPQQLMLAAFNACMTAIFVREAQREGLMLSHLEIVTTGNVLLTAYETDPYSEKASPETLRYFIHVSGSGTLSQFDRIHQRVIALSPTRGMLAHNMMIEGDLTVGS